MSAKDLHLDEGMEGVVREHRDRVVVHCYQFLGSFHEAEEAAQEVFLRAWRSRAGFRGDSSMRTWLLKIATRVCLDLLRSRRRRVVPATRGPASDPVRPVGEPEPEVAWLEPIPSRYIGDSSQDPASVYSMKESVRLAFLAAVQTLPARQRAVLILRDVLSWSAAETAATLECSVPSVTSALHRARTQMRETYHQSGVESMPGHPIQDPDVRRTLDAFVTAWERADVESLVETLREDVRMAMPPIPSWYDGRADVVTAFATLIVPLGRYLLLPAFFNAQPSYTVHLVDPDGESTQIADMVLSVDASGIGAIDVFAGH
ncbi:RNA polymerase subunit sigma-70 [Jannaschia sp. R86511]|uniref:RNA polymerase subunit sigma-70 n=1 Tax=Jannaschia sp. R86511 TaxID=3093853 RepID=UPI0036D26860